jgi:hypothetical protein
VRLMYLNSVTMSLLSQSPTLSGNSPGDTVSVTFSTVFSLKLTMQPLLQTSYPAFQIITTQCTQLAGTSKYHIAENPVACIRGNER